MTICYFGIYQKDYCRNKNTIIGLRKNGVKVIEVQDRTPGPIKFWKLFKMHWQVRKDYDMMIVGFPGQIIVPLAKLLTRKPIIFDIHVSFFDANVRERKTCKAKSLKGIWFYFLDWISCSLADKILLDTQAHVDYVVELFKGRIKKNKFIVTYHGCDDELFFPMRVEKKTDKFIIEFHGYITNVHGIEYVLPAMKKLENENIELWVIGGGMRYKEMKEISQELNLKNVKFYPPIRPPELNDLIAQADVSIGNLGISGRANKVIANKLYEAIAMKIPVVNVDGPALREKFIHKEHIYLCQGGNIDAIANAFLELKNNPAMRESMVENAYKLMKEELVPEVLGRNLLRDLAKDYDVVKFDEKIKKRFSILAQNKIFAHTDRIDEWLKRGMNWPVTIELDPSNACNHKCPGCVGGRVDGNILDLKFLTNIVDQIATHGRGLTITGGGEPLVNKHTLDIIKYAKQKGLDIGFITNGGLINEENAKILVENCVWVRISIDAHSPKSFLETHGMPEQEFNKVWQNTAILSQARDKYNPDCTIGTGYLTNQKTRHDMYEFAKKAKKAGVNYVQFRPYHGNRTNVIPEITQCQELETDNFRIISSIHKYEQMDGVGWSRNYNVCFGHHFGTVIGADGKMYLCCHMRGDPKYCLGDLSKNSFEEIWFSPQRAKVYQNIDFNDCPPICRYDAFNEILWNIYQLKKQGEHINFL